jgi:DNA-binding CsgD family transcriptional regulator
MATTGGNMCAETSKTVALKPREAQVLGLLAEGCTYWNIAARLGVSPHTVVTHIKNVYRKLGVHNAASAVVRAMRQGLLQLEVEQ